MNTKEFIDIMKDDEFSAWEGCNALQGLKIIEKYLPGKGIMGAEHDIIYSVDVEKLIEADITLEDTKKLNKLNWMIQDDYLACFV